MAHPKRHRHASFADKVKAIMARGHSIEHARAIAGAMIAKKRDRAAIGKAIRKLVEE